MSRLVSMLLAEGASIDALSGRLTVFNALDRINTNGFPAGLGRLMVVLVYEHDGEAPRRFFERVLLQAPDGSELTRSQTGVQLRPSEETGSLTHRSLHALWRLAFKEPGTYKVVLEHSESSDGPWQHVQSRTLLAQERDYPFFKKREAEDEDVRALESADPTAASGRE